ncbi:MAG TPA: lytic transglycosylase domain-containing protein [Beijerinckiaceae bacterium]|jgi:soluble lytic murein transglycosylase
MVIATRRRPGVALLAGAVLALSAAPPRAQESHDQARDRGTPVRLAMLDDVAFGRLSVSDLEPQAPKRLDLAVLKQALEAYRRGDIAEGDKLRGAVADEAARALTEWVAIRSTPTVGFDRIAGFLREDASWPAGALIRKRAEEALLFQRKAPATVRAYFATQRPTTSAGKFALALAFQADGLDRDAAALVRDAWRKDNFGREFETKILEKFPNVLTQGDHRFRMERQLFKENWEAARRAAARAGAGYEALVKARIAASDNAKKTASLLDAVPAALKGDSSYAFSRAQWLRRNDKPLEAAKVMAEVTRDPAMLADGDEWWVERRIVARKLLDKGDARAAYEVVAGHGAESAANKIEAEFQAAWIALRFLDEPALAAGHLRTAARFAETPISLARVAYWQGRTAEAVGAEEVAQRHYERAAAYPITYYGQLARAKLGDALVLRAAAEPTAPGRESFQRLTAARALRLLYGLGVPDLALALHADLSQRLNDAGQLEALGDLAAEHRDARGLLVVGKSAVQRGFPLDTHAYPTIGIPVFDPVGGRVDKAMVYAVARQESMFDPKAQSHAGARGLMQLMPATAKRTAKRFGLNFDTDKLTADPAYNAKIGSAHLGELMQDWRGSLILVFASYNAGGGNVKKWIDAYGDPRRPEIDVVDWIERIPFSETRNYVQRVLENFQVYRHRLGGDRSALLSESDLRRSAALH